jgi:hypothetical protein
MHSQGTFGMMVKGEELEAAAHRKRKESVRE